jgi:hypothetical protein
MAPRLPWDIARDVPWHLVKSPLDQWRDQPSFLIGEVLFIACAIVALLHARKNGRDHLLVWIAALAAGTANDLIFMALPFVDNFWQAQATVMLTPRLPLYIPCVYVCFMYFPTVSVWRVGLPAIPRAAATGLAAIVFYAPYDIVGARYLWWTWHNSDPRITHRLLGAPLGSTMFVITFVAGFSLLLNAVLDRAKTRDPISWRTFGKGLALAALASSLVMVLQMTVLQFFDARLPGPRGLVAIVVVYLGLIVWGLRKRATPDRAFADRPLWIAGLVYFVTMGVLAVAFDARAHVSTGLHQNLGPCGVEATDIQGLTRHVFACETDPAPGTTIDPAPALGDGIWYTVRGAPEASKGVVGGAVWGLALLGMGVYSTLLRSRQRGSIRTLPP